MNKKTNTLFALLIIMIALSVINLGFTTVLFAKSMSVQGIAKQTQQETQQATEQTAQQKANAQTGQTGQAKLTISIDDDPIKGDKNAPVTIVEFGDFQCPFCGRFYQQTLPLIEENYIKTGKARLVYRDFPLSFHPMAHKAAEAAGCAYKQGKFWEYHDKLFENQRDLSIENFKTWAKELGLNTEEFNNCLDQGLMASEVDNDFNQGVSYGVSGTPTFFINGVKVVGAQPFSVFKQVIDQALQEASQQ